MMRQNPLGIWHTLPRLPCLKKIWKMAMDTIGQSSKNLHNCHDCVNYKRVLDEYVSEIWLGKIGAHLV